VALRLLASAESPFQAAPARSSHTTACRHAALPVARDTARQPPSPGTLLRGEPRRRGGLPRVSAQGAWAFRSLTESEGVAGRGTGGRRSVVSRCCLSSPGSDATPCLLGPPVDPEEDAENSAVYVQGLGDNATLEDLADFFKQCGAVKVRRGASWPLGHGGRGLPTPHLPCMGGCGAVARAFPKNRPEGPFPPPRSCRNGSGVSKVGSRTGESKTPRRRDAR